MSTFDVAKVDGEYHLTAGGLLRMVEQTDPMEVKAGPSREWFVDFQRRRPNMSKAEATREVLRRISCEHLMPSLREVSK